MKRYITGVANLRFATGKGLFPGGWIKAIPHVFTAALVSLGVLLLPAMGHAQEEAPSHATGALPSMENIAPAARSLAMAPLPDSVDLRQWSVPVGNQGSVGSCVAWAIGYAMKGWYANKTGLPDPIFAPMYMYSQIHTTGCGSPECGAYTNDAFSLLKDQGIDVASDYSQYVDRLYGAWPYAPFYDWRTQPTTAQKFNAAQYKISGWSTLFSTYPNGGGVNGMTEIKNALSNGQPVAIMMPVRQGFDRLTKANDLDTDTTSASRGLHEIFAVGYDQDGLLIQNSWGTDWGNSGFGRLAWSVVQKDVSEARVINQAISPAYTITASAGTGGSINPSGAVTVNSGATRSFTVTPNANYAISSVGGTCGGTLSGNTYTTGAITANCTVTAAFVYQTTPTYTVTASAGTGGTINPSGAVTVSSGAVKTFTVTPNANYVISSVGGTCGGSFSGNTYTTNAIYSNCTVTAAFVYQTTPTYTVTASAGTGGAISPSGAVAVNSGATRAFTVTPNTGYVISSVGGTCGGTLSGNTYTTRAITANCTVTAAFVYQTTPYYAVTASAGAGGTISPSGINAAVSGSTVRFTVTPNPGYVATVGGTCGGTLSGNTYTTYPITANCTVTAAFVYQATPTYTVTASAGTGGAISPSGAVVVNSGVARAFTVTPNTGYAISSVGGTCGGTLSGNTYTTRAITANCTVTAAFAYREVLPYSVTASAGVGGTISPSGTGSVLPGTTKTFTVTPNTGYAISSVGGTCGGTLSGNTYTTYPVNANCTVTAAFVYQPISYYTVTA
ncbi:MAG: hypothetical protein FWG56_02315, partial [Desulfovibrionaceae bacterium]|nr:hypothetical protein [Desulfovibrionaceae bacterium]